MLGRVFILVSTIAVFHAAYSTYEHLSHLKALGKPEGFLPSDIILEASLALVLGIIGACLNAAPLKEITWASEMRIRSIDEMDERPGFASYVNRGTSFLAPNWRGRSDDKKRK